MPRASEMRKLLISLDTGQHNALEIFTVTRNILSEGSKELLNSRKSSNESLY